MGAYWSFAAGAAGLAAATTWALATAPLLATAALAGVAVAAAWHERNRSARPLERRIPQLALTAAWHHVDAARTAERVAVYRPNAKILLTSNAVIRAKYACCLPADRPLPAATDNFASRRF